MHEDACTDRDVESHLSHLSHLSHRPAKQRLPTSKVYLGVGNWSLGVDRRSSAMRAASCSASFFAFPLAAPRTSPPTTTSTLKSLRWSGPASPAMRYSGSGRPSACTRSCSADL